MSKVVEGCRRACAVLLAAAAFAGGAAAQAPPSPTPPAEAAEPEPQPGEPGDVPTDERFDPSLFTPMEVMRRPTWQDTRSFRPPRARQDGRDGKVVLECRLTVSTLLEECKVLSEEPAGYGYADMAFKAAELFRIRPPQYGRQPVRGATARIPMTFTVEETPAERRKRLGSMVRSPDVLWAPQGFAVAVGLVLAWALFWPMRRRRPKGAGGL